MVRGRGSLVLRCNECGTCTVRFKHNGTPHPIIYPVRRREVKLGGIIKSQECESAPLNEKNVFTKDLAEILPADGLKAVRDGTFRELHRITLNR